MARAAREHLRLEVTGGGTRCGPGREFNEGDVGAGDEVRLIHRPAHGITIGAVGDIYLRDHARAELLLRAPALAERWHAWARERGP